MIKPILKIEVPMMDDENLDKLSEKLASSTAAAEYHIIVIGTGTQCVSMEIITAPDASIHKP